MVLWRTDLRTRLITGNSVREVSALLEKMAEIDWFGNMVVNMKKKYIQERLKNNG